MAAAGTSPFGVAPYGIGTPSGATVPPADQVRGCKLIDYRTGDYARGPDGAYLRMPRTRHRVMMALGTLLDSASAVPGFGTRFPDRIDESYERSVREEVRRRLKPLIDSFELVLDSVTVEQETTGRVRHTVAYTPSDGSPDSITF